ncbi:unnamed protein product [Clonostachys rhizophaga]|uniref:Uncharacterized protein n=1 Tax=Clonostachys rhizophaga TaxID=160324 RepID=A0A9N9VWR0_9HYPO|nr:unnamed protein product [Clonostachys rhizophaga]
MSELRESGPINISYERLDTGTPDQHRYAAVMVLSDHGLTHAIADTVLDIEKCIYTAAQIECAKPCEGDDEGNAITTSPSSNAHKKQLHEHIAAGDPPDMACNSYLTAAFEKYASCINQAKCICCTIASNGLTSSTCYRPAALQVINVTPKASVAIGGTGCTSFGVKLSYVLFMTLGVTQAWVNLLTPALAPPCADPQLETWRRRLWNQAIKAGLTAFVASPSLYFLGARIYLTDKKEKAIVSIVLGPAVRAIAVPEIHQPALSTLFYSPGIELDMLVVTNINATYLYSVVAFGFQMAGKPLGTFEFVGATLLIILTVVRRLIVTFSHCKAISAVSVQFIQHTMANRRHHRERSPLTEERFFDGEKKGFTTDPAKVLVASGNQPVSAAFSKHQVILTSEDNVKGHVTDIHVVPGAGIEDKFGDDVRTLHAGRSR